MRLPVDFEREVALEHVDDLRCARRMRLGPVDVPRLETPVPELDVIELVAADQQPSATAAGRLQLHDLVSRDHPHAPPAPESTSSARPTSSPCARRTRVAKRGIDALLLYLDEHAAADAGPFGKLLERQPALGTQAPQVARQRIGSIFRIGHSSPPSVIDLPSPSELHSNPTQSNILSHKV